MSQTEQRYQIIDRNGVLPDAHCPTLATARLVAARIAPTDWPVAIFDRLAHKGKPNTWNLLPNGDWRITDHA